MIDLLEEDIDFDIVGAGFSLSNIMFLVMTWNSLYIAIN